MRPISRRAPLLVALALGCVGSCLFGYATRRPTITAQMGSAGDVAFDEKTGRFDVSVLEVASWNWFPSDPNSVSKCGASA
jgi:TRAP-type mannitol/chloroaromatic compound transport system permease large subunit